MKNVNGWVIVAIDDVLKGKEGEVTDVSFETPDARINGAYVPAIEALKFAKPGWTYAVRFQRGKVTSALELQRN
jgi:hypothetical protein